jgi:membrane glycosyltransferase
MDASLRGQRAAQFGGPLKVLLSIAAEVILTTLLAPLRMLAHSKFVFGTLVGHNVQWTPPPRTDSDTGWRDALRFHGSGMVLALVWGVVVFTVNRPFFWWLSPILLPMILGVPISVWSSRATWGSDATGAGSRPPWRRDGRD